MEDKEKTESWNPLATLFFPLPPLDPMIADVYKLSLDELRATVLETRRQLEEARFDDR
jgi:hypothetical protein